MNMSFEDKKAKPESPFEDKIQSKDGKSSKNIEMSEKFQRLVSTQIDWAAQEVSNENVPFSLKLWDLGGQNDFINTHHLFLDVEATTLIVLDTTKKIHESFKGKIKLGNPKTPGEVLCYWLNSFYVEGLAKGCTPNIAVVLTHTDLVKTEDIQHYIDEIIMAVQGKPYANLISEENIYTADNKQGNDDDFQKLRNHLLQSFAKQKSWGANIPTRWQKLEADLVEKVSNDKRQYIEMSKLKNMGQLYGMDDADIEAFLKLQTDLGNFLHFEVQKLRNIIIIDPQWLVDKCKEVITHPEFFNSRNLSQATLDNLKKGIVTEENLEELWNREESEFLTDLMLNFNLFTQIEHTETEGQRYLIPCMMPESYNDVAQYYSSMIYLYNASHIAHTGDRLLVGTFHRLLSACTRASNWKLDEQISSYTQSSLIIGNGLILELSLQEIGTVPEVKTNILGNSDALKRDLTPDIEDIKKVLTKNMTLFNIAQPSQFLVICPNYVSGDIPSFDPPWCMIEAEDKGDNCIDLLEQQCSCHRRDLPTDGFSWIIKSLFRKLDDNIYFRNLNCRKNGYCFFVELSCFLFSLQDQR